MSVISSRQFNQDTSAAKREAAKGPVFITDRGKPAHVLLTIDDYLRLAKSGPSVVEALSMPAGQDIDFDPPKFDEVIKPADFS